MMRASTGHKTYKRRFFFSSALDAALSRLPDENQDLSPFGGHKRRVKFIRPLLCRALLLVD